MSLWWRYCDHGRKAHFHVGCKKLRPYHPQTSYTSCQVTPTSTKGRLLGSQVLARTSIGGRFFQPMCQLLPHKGTLLPRMHLGLKIDFFFKVDGQRKLRSKLFKNKRQATGEAADTRLDAHQRQKLYLQHNWEKRVRNPVHYRKAWEDGVQPWRKVLEAGVGKQEVNVPIEAPYWRWQEEHRVI